VIKRGHSYRYEQAGAIAADDEVEISKPLDL
jgi:hypothetical protein